MQSIVNNWFEMLTFLLLDNKTAASLVQPSTSDFKNAQNAQSSRKKKMHVNTAIDSV